MKFFNNRADDLNVSIAEMSRILCGHKDLIGRSLAGSRVFKPNELVGMAKMLKLPVALVLDRLGYKAPSYQVPLIGVITQESRVSPFTAAEMILIRAPTDMEADLVAVQVAAPHSALGVYQGNVLYYTPRPNLSADVFGRLCVVSAGDRPFDFVGVLDRAASIGLARVLLLNGSALETKQLITASPVLWQSYN